MKLPPFDYVECTSVEQAVGALGQHGEDARLIAGGTVVVPLMKHDLLRPEVLVSIERIDQLADIVDDGTAVRVGALARHHDIVRSSSVRSAAPLLARACGRVASPVIRSMGTIGGNLCYAESASDPSPALLALGARVNVAGPGGARSIPIEEFFIGFYETAVAEDELVTSVDVPRLSGDATWTYVKWTPRAREDKPLIGLAAVLAAGNGSARARLAVGGIDSRPVPLAAASDVLTGSGLSDRVIDDAAEAAANEVDPMDDLQGSAGYRREMLRVWVRRILRELREQVETAA